MDNGKHEQTRHNQESIVEVHNTRDRSDIRVSLIICTRNEFSNLKEVLDIIYKMKFEFHEVLVFDDASSDNTSDKAVYFFGDRSNFRMVTFANQKGYPALRNEGIVRATGDYLLFLDSGFVLDEPSLEKLIEECPHYNIVYPNTNDLDTAGYSRFKKAHESYIKFSHCYIVKKSSLYCFNGTFYDTNLGGVFCDFDFFCRAQIFGLSAFLVDDAAIRWLNGVLPDDAREKFDADKDQALFRAIYHDADSLETIRLILEALENTKIVPVQSTSGSLAETGYINNKRTSILDNNNSFYYRYRDSYSRKMSDSHFALIEVTNSCIRRCSHCTRGVSLLKEYQHMGLDEIENALKSLKGWRRPVGLFGGEPTIHPNFLEICGLLERYFPKEQRALFTCGGHIYNKHQDMIEERFGIINYNDHEDTCFHQPVLVASSEVMKDDKMLDVLIRRCWVGQIYCYIITKKGGFFCEVAATLDLLHQGKGGFKLEPGWWKKDASQCQEQIEEYCQQCGMCLPLSSIPDNHKKEIMTSRQYQRLRKHISEKHLEIEIYDRTHDAMSIFSEKGSRKENYTSMNSRSYWYKENVLDTRKKQQDPEDERLLTQ